MCVEEREERERERARVSVTVHFLHECTHKAAHTQRPHPGSTPQPTPNTLTPDPPPALPQVCTLHEPTFLQLQLRKTPARQPQPGRSTSCRRRHAERRQPHPPPTPEFPRKPHPATPSPHLQGCAGLSNACCHRRRRREPAPTPLQQPASAHCSSARTSPRALTGWRPSTTSSVAHGPDAQPPSLPCPPEGIFSAKFKAVIFCYYIFVNFLL